MANECKVFEMQSLRNRAEIFVVPFLAYTELSDNGVVTFGKSTQMINVYSSLAGTLTFSSASGTTPDGTVAPFPINALEHYQFDVRPGTVMRFDT